MPENIQKDLGNSTLHSEVFLDDFMFDYDAKSIISQSIETSKDYSDFLNYYSVQVQPTLLLIGEGKEAKKFLDTVKSYPKIPYQVGLLNAKDIISISGNLGEFEAKIKISNTESTLEPQIGKVEFSQAVIFYEDDYLTRFMGIEKANDYNDALELLQALDSRIGEYRYEKKINYNPDYCQYLHRRPNKHQQGYCHKCADICPTFGVGKDDSLMELVFSKIDCIGCGNCVSVCPSGALERDGYDKEALFEIAKLYKNKTPVVMDFETFTTLKNFDFCNCVPLLLPQVNFLNEMYLMTLIQESGSQIIIFTKNPSENLIESAKLINNIYNSIASLQTVHIVKETKSLIHLCNTIKPNNELFYTYAQNQREPLRNIFAQRLMFLIKNNDYGKIKNTKTSTYGEIILNQDACTLCMSCVGACNVRSLSANASNFSLQFNPSSCTSCGYCVDSCPENAISLELSGISLNPSWFENKTLAQDKMFECIECNKPFATTKSIQKIKSIMLPVFQNDEAKIRSLECCPDCKVKVMFEKNFEAFI
ncbi:4Fe-4S binding protein [Helicobacter cappadocius]|uniref:4Fe-4S binding protein n=1 Tax=Helicobacter cappadocius TaxID=3063998 RepID=A0AA90TES9_9HELI|nr:MULTISPECIES: 4Fe-4S binding protein [unclassified Helicobacter]MDO7252882.1 4Fe-4S binding protein [Helicobacter sp. faydin-H75]MDP2538925.1 4Fe-4S binding protein [Helicobacter sp. faydin-H76]